MPVRTRLLGTTILSSVVGASFVMPHTVSAADLYTKAPQSIFAPAVDGFNVKADAFGGSMAHQSVAGIRGAFAMPLASSYGLQVDVQGGSVGGSGYGSVSPHLFWRDPSYALIGIYANYTHLDRFGGADLGQVAAEGQLYLGRWTLEGVAGVEFGNSTSVTTSSTAVIPQNFVIPGNATTSTFTEGFDIKTRFFDQINLKYYLTDNWDAYVGHRYLGGKHAFALGTEYAMPVAHRVMASAFVEGRVGSGEFQGVWGGLRMYFGQKDKTLIQRHRQDDPTAWDTLFSILNSHTNSSGATGQPFCTDGILAENGTCEFGS
jgi:hypothetical protein